MSDGGGEKGSAHGEGVAAVGGASVQTDPSAREGCGDVETEARTRSSHSKAAAHPLMVALASKGRGDGLGGAVPRANGIWGDARWSQSERARRGWLAWSHTARSPSHSRRVLSPSYVLSSTSRGSKRPSCLGCPAREPCRCNKRDRPSARALHSGQASILACGELTAEKVTTAAVVVHPGSHHRPHEAGRHARGLVGKRLRSRTFGHIFRRHVPCLFVGSPEDPGDIPPQSHGDQ